MAFLFDHVHLFSADPNAAGEFYVRVLGARRLRGSVEGRVDLKLGGQKLLISAAPPEHRIGCAPQGAFAHLALLVSDLEAAAVELRNKGAEFLTPPRQVRPGIKAAFVAAPDGVEVEVIERSDGRSPL